MTENQFLQTSRQVFALVSERFPDRFAELDVQDARADTKDPVVLRYAAISKNKADLWHINFCSYNLVFSPKAAGVGLWHTQLMYHCNRKETGDRKYNDALGHVMSRLGGKDGFVFNRDKVVFNLTRNTHPTPASQLEQTLAEGMTFLIGKLQPEINYLIRTVGKGL